MHERKNVVSSGPLHGATDGGDRALPFVGLDSAPGRWILTASILGSGAVFVESSVANVALPAIGREFGLGISGLQWIINGYLLTLSALILLGGALGDRYRRGRVFALGLVGFAASSLACALAPSAIILVCCRVLQGMAGALVVPNSLAILETTFEPSHRPTAIGRWAAGSSVSAALGPLVGGWLVDAFSWRWVFAVVVAFALAAAWIVVAHERHLPEADRSAGTHSLDYRGAVLATVGLAGVVGALMTIPLLGARSSVVIVAAAGGAACLVAFVIAERHASAPLMPLEVFRSRQFSGANLVTLFVYASLGILLFLLMLELQDALGYSALRAGLTLLPINILMLLLAPRAARLAQRIGPRLPMTAGCVLTAAGMLLLLRVHPGARFGRDILPAVVVFGLGLGTLVGPLTAAVLAAVEDRLAGVASAVNNAVARLAGLLATAVLPLAAGLGGAESLRGDVLTQGFHRTMWMAAFLCLAGALTSWLTIGQGGPPNH